MSDCKKRILILGAGVMQGPAIASAKAMGIEAIVIDGDPHAPMACEADRFEVIDLKDIHKIEEFAKKLQKEGGLDGIVTAGTDFSASVAYAAESLGLPGIPYQAALDASDKERMRERFKEAGLPSPDFVVFTKETDLRLPFPYPAVVKPVDNMGARGCRRVDNDEELKEAVENALHFSRSGRAIAEEYMEGPEFSVDAIVYRGEITMCGLADRHIFFPPYFIEMGHTMPTEFSSTNQEALLSVFIRGIRALGIENGAAKGDIKLTSRGPMIGEIAARLSGGYMSGWTYPYASGVNPAEGAISVALGQKPERLTPQQTWTSAERAFISIPGLVASIIDSEAAGKMPHIKNLFLRCETGKRISFPENNVSKAGNVISAAPDRHTAVQAAENATKTILIRLAAPDESTEAFLANDSPFPPPAYSLNQAQQEQLNQMTPGILCNKLLQNSSRRDAEPAKEIENVVSSSRKDTKAQGTQRKTENLKTDLSSPRSLRSQRLCEIKSENKSIGLIPFPAFMESNLVDYMGRSPQETMEAVKKLTGLELTEAKPGSLEPVLGVEFWTSLIRGGYQGAVYYIDMHFCRIK